ncbi:MAG: response regulator transcription factor [Pseudomonadota bacterium]
MANTTAVHIIDDDEAVRDSLSSLLDAHGLAVVIHSSARAFLEGVEPGPDDCVVTDVLMPDMGGLALLRALRARRSRVPVILVAGRPDNGLAEAANALGAFVLIDKPFAADTLLQAVRDAMAPRA